MILGISAIVVAAIAIIMFLRATNVKQPIEEKQRLPPIGVEVKSRKVNIPELQKIAQKNQVEQARKQIRTLTLQQEILSMVMKRLFEAEDNEEISRDERERLSKNYEKEMHQVKEQLDRAELIISLNELEQIRTNIVEQFQHTLSETQSQIDLIIKELDIRQPRTELEEKEPETTQEVPRRRRPRPQPPEEEPEEEQIADEGEDEAETPKKRETVEDRLDKLKQDVLKELEELDRLELEQ
jgi:hypothetical protein